MSKQN